MPEIRHLNADMRSMPSKGCTADKFLSFSAKSVAEDGVSTLISFEQTIASIPQASTAALSPPRVRPVHQAHAASSGLVCFVFFWGWWMCSLPCNTSWLARCLPWSNICSTREEHCLVGPEFGSPASSPGARCPPAQPWQFQGSSSILMPLAPARRC